MIASISARPTGGVSCPPPPDRPQVEWWTVGGDRFESTAALCASPAATSGKSTTYHYFPIAADATREALTANTIKNAKTAAFCSGVLGAAAAGVVLALTSVTPLGVLMAAGLTALFAGAGAALSASFSEAYARDGSTVTGTLDTTKTQDGTTVKFQTKAGKTVDLQSWTRGEAPTEAWWRETDMPVEAYVFRPY